MSTHEAELIVTVAGIGPCGVEYGLQDKAGALHEGAPVAGGEQFRCVVTVRAGSDGAGPPGGPFVHGKPGGRFLYLSFRGADGGWMRRTKIALPDQLQTTAGVMTAAVRDVGTPWVAVEQAWSGGLEQ